MFTTFTSTVSRVVIGTVGTAFCAGLCLVAATAPAGATEVGTGMVRTTTVSYADLDVHTAHGRAVLDHRLATAARVVCRSTDAGQAARFEEGRCIHRALATATLSIGRDSVIAAR